MRLYHITAPAVCSVGNSVFLLRNVDAIKAIWHGDLAWGGGPGVVRSVRGGPIYSVRGEPQDFVRGEPVEPWTAFILRQAQDERGMVVLRQAQGERVMVVLRQAQDERGMVVLRQAQDERGITSSGRTENE